MALCDRSQAPKFTVAIGGTADAEGRAAMGTLDAIVEVARRMISAPGRSQNRA